MQSKNKDDSVQLSNRYRLYMLAKRHLGGFGGRQVFPIGEGNEETDSKFEIVGNTNNAGRGERSRVFSDSGIVSCLTSTDYKQPKQIAQLNKPKHSNDRVYGEEGVSPTLNTAQGGNRQPFVSMKWQRTEKGKQARAENQKEEGRDYTPFSEGHRECVPVEGKPVGALTSQAVAKDSLVGNDMRIRRLTPTECERLMSIPDGWTEYGNFDGEIKEISDTQRYKMCGNGVVVNVVEKIIKRLFF